LAAMPEEDLQYLKDPSNPTTWNNADDFHFVRNESLPRLSAVRHAIVDRSQVLLQGTT
jgi:hypothetical protein